MTEQDKQLLLQDLCARLPYGVICEVTFDVDNIFTETLEGINTKYINQITTSGSSCNIECIKPYLRPMSSMTEEEFILFMGLRGRNLSHYDIQQMMKEAFSMPNHLVIVAYLDRYLQNINWLLSKHFDVNGLIPAGLAIEVTEENNPYKD